MARPINRMFSLTKYINQDFNRSSGDGGWDDTTGKYVEGSKSVVTLQCNIQPFKFSETLQLDTAERKREWLNVRSQSEIKQLEEGDDGWEADTFTYNGKLFEVMKVKSYKMGILDHYHAQAASVPKTPIGVDMNG